MPSSNVSVSELLARGLRLEFRDTYDRAIKEADPHLKNVMVLDVPSDKISEIYGYTESAPHWKRWQRGEEIPRNGFRSRNFTVVNHDWGIAIDWHDNDEQDDQSMSLVSRVRDAAVDAAILPERVFFQILLGSTDNDLLPYTPNAPDGSAFFATTDGSGANRFGATNGNSLATSGIGSTALIQQDFFRAWSQFRLFKDTDSQPLWPPELLNRGITVIYGAQNEQVFRQAFHQLFVQGQSAAPSNVIVNTNMVSDLWSTPRITDNSWYVFLNSATKKSVFQQVRQSPRDLMEDFVNSDFTRRTKIKAMQFDARYGYGLALPYQGIKIS
jgi:phage major head subunit gpT-like protein